MGRNRKLVAVNEDLIPLQSFSEIFGKFPVICGKCYKEIGSKLEMIAFCEASSFQNFVWFTPIHSVCGQKICEETEQVLVPADMLRQNIPSYDYTKILFMKKGEK